MVKRILVAWGIANFAIPGLAAWLAGGWYLSWRLSPLFIMLAELGLIMLPNLLLPVLVVRYAWDSPVPSIRQALGWGWNGWRSLICGLAAFLAIFWLTRVIVVCLGESIPYQLPAQDGAGVPVQAPSDVVKILGLLSGLAAFVVLTVVAEESMFRGFIQTQVSQRNGVWIGLLLGAVLFGLRHLPADLFYAGLWRATPQMWLSRQVQLYLAALGLGLARHFGKSTYASAITHGCLLVSTLFGLGL